MVLALLAGLQQEFWLEVRTRLSNIALTLHDQNHLANAESYFRFALDVATLSDHEQRSLPALD